MLKPVARNTKLHQGNAILIIVLILVRDVSLKGVLSSETTYFFIFLFYRCNSEVRLNVKIFMNIRNLRQTGRSVTALIAWDSAGK